MIRLLLALLLVAPAHAGVLLLKDAAPQNRRWVYDDGFIEIILTDKQAVQCRGSWYLYVLAPGNQKIDGCWEEADALVHVKYDSGYKFVVKAHKFVEVKMSDTPIIKLTENERP
jgi:hypothetical protein